MEFCPNCNRRYIPKRPGTDGTVAFVCDTCGESKAGTADDTLWFEDAKVGETERFQMIIERAPFDLAGQTMPIECDECGRQYMTLVRFGKSAITLYVCKCGARRDHTMKKI